MRAAGLALACAIIGGGVALGYVAADRGLLAGLGLLDLMAFEPSKATSDDSATYPHANRDGKVDRLAPLRTDRQGIEPAQVLPRGDSLRQSYAAVDPVAAIPPPVQTGPPPLPKPRPKAQLLMRRQQASYTLLSDLQIDAIRARLNLSAEQERAWPAVEEALRDLASRLHDMKKTGHTPTDLRADSEEFAKLKTAAGPFIASLSAGQKGELRMLAHLVGLGPVVAKL